MADFVVPFLVSRAEQQGAVLWEMWEAKGHLSRLGTLWLFSSLNHSLQEYRAWDSPMVG